MKKLISVLLAVSALALSTSAFAASADAIDGKVFREGDTIQFVVEDATDLTLISYQDEENIQYVDETTNGTISYKVRDLAEGAYKLVIKAGEDKVTYNYTVADFDLIPANENYIAGKNGDQVFYAAFATIKGASFVDAGVKGVTFKFNGKAVSDYVLGADLDAYAGEVDAKTAVYGITMTGVPAEADIAVEAVEVK